MRIVYICRETVLKRVMVNLNLNKFEERWVEEGQRGCRRGIEMEEYRGNR